MNSNKVRAAIDASDLGAAATLIKQNPTLGREALSYLLYKLSQGQIKFKKGFFGTDYKPLETILKLFTTQQLSPQDEQMICNIGDTSVKQIIGKLYKNIDCNRTSQYPTSGYPPQYPPQGYQSSYQGYPQRPYSPPVYPQNPYPSQGYPQRSYQGYPQSPNQGYPPVYAGRAGVRSKTRYRKNRQRQRQKTQKTQKQKQKRKSNK